MPTHPDQPGQPDRAHLLLAQSRDIITQTRRVIDLTRQRLDRQISMAVPAAQQFRVRLGCEVCGARATFRDAVDIGAFLDTHPYACEPSSQRLVSSERSILTLKWVFGIMVRVVDCGGGGAGGRP